MDTGAADLDLHADAADPRVRGARQAHVRGAPGRDPRPHPPRRRRRGVDRRLARDARARRPGARDLPLPRLPARARHRPEGDDGRDLRPHDGLCGGYGGSMHLVDVSRGFLGTSGIVGQGIPHATGAAYAAQIRGKGQVVLCFFGDGASKQGAFHESLNIASLWKLPIVYVMENNNYNVVTRVEQEDANAAAGRAARGQGEGALSMPGVTVDGGDPVAVYEVVAEAVERARSGGGPDARRVARLPARAPTATSSRRPACRCTTRSTRRSPSSATRRSTRRRCEATRSRASARGSSPTGRSPPSRPTRSPPRCATRCRRRSTFGLESPFPAPEEAIKLRLRLGGGATWHTSFPTSPRSARRSARRWRATSRSSTSARTSPPPRTTRSCRPFGSDRVRVTPISETAEIGMAVGAAFAGYRPVVELYMAEFMLVAMDQVVNEAPRFHYMTGGQVKVPIVLKAGYGFTAGWAGQHTGSIYGMFMGVPGLKVAVPSTRRRREGPDDRRDPRRQPGRLLPPLPADARARRGARTASTSFRSARPPSGARAPTSRSSRSAGSSTRRSPPPSSSPARGIEAEVIDPRTLAPLDTAHDPRRRSRRPAGSSSPTSRRGTARPRP